VRASLRVENRKSKSLCRIRATHSLRRRCSTNGASWLAPAKEIVLGVSRVVPELVRPLQRQPRLCKHHASIGDERSALCSAPHIAQLRGALVERCAHLGPRSHR